MKVIIPHIESLKHQSIRLGWLNALKAAGHNVLLWNTEYKNPIDVFDEYLPDLVILSSREFNRHFYKAAIKHKDHVKIAVFLDDDEYTTDTEFAIIEKLLGKEGKVFGFTLNDSYHIPTTHKRWSELFPVITSLPPAADTVRFQPGNYRAEYASEVSYIGKWMPYKDYLLPFLQNNDFQLKIYGYGEWNHPCHIGAICDNQTYRDVIASSRINLFIHNSNQKYVSEKWYKLIACGAYPLCFTSPDMTGVGYHRIVQQNLDNVRPEEMKLDGENEINRVLKTNNYHERMKELLKCIN